MHLWSALHEVSQLSADGSNKRISERMSPVNFLSTIGDGGAHARRKMCSLVQLFYQSQW